MGDKQQIGIQLVARLILRFVAARRKRLILLAVLSGLLLQLPVLYYKLQTPFALIDDYSGDLVLTKYPLAAISSTVAHNFTDDVERFRPLYYVEKWVCGQAFGENAAMYHLYRYSIKLLILAFAARLIYKRDSNRSLSALAVVLFGALFMFYPVCPDARLSPTELYQVLFLTCMMGLLGKIYANDERRSGEHATLALLWISMSLFALAKEPGVAIVAVFTALLAWRIRSRADLLRWLPFAGLFALYVIKVHAASQVAGYGKVDPSIDLILGNLESQIKLVSGFKISPLIALVLVGLPLFVVARSIRLWRSNELLGFFENNRAPAKLWLATSLCLLAIFCVNLLAQYIAIRYIFPATFLLHLLCALSLCLLYRDARRRNPSPPSWLTRHALTKLHVAVFAFAIYFVGACYANLLAQYTSQYYARNLERQVLDEIESRLDAGEKVYVPCLSEFECAVCLYFHLHVAENRGEPCELVMIDPLEHPPVGSLFFDNVYTLNRPGEIVWSRSAKEPGMTAPLGLRTAARISKILCFGRLKFWSDAGAPPPGFYAEPYCYAIKRRSDDREDPALVRERIESRRREWDVLLVVRKQIARIEATKVR